MTEEVDDLLDDYWDELNDIEEIMGTPPGGHNYGRSKSTAGSWMPLETDWVTRRSNKEYAEPRKHGTAYVYKIGCRCDLCREWKRDENAMRDT